MVGSRGEAAGPSGERARRRQTSRPVRPRLIGTELTDLAGTTLAHVFVGLSLDLDSFGRLRTAQAQTRATRAREQQVREQLVGDVEASLARVRVAQDIVPEARSAVEAGERNFAIQSARFEAGTGLGIELIYAQNVQARARLRLAEAIIRYNVAQLELAASIGHLSPDLLTSAAARPRP